LLGFLQQGLTFDILFLSSFGFILFFSVWCRRAYILALEQAWVHQNRSLDAKDWSFCVGWLSMFQELIVPIHALVYYPLRVLHHNFCATCMVVLSSVVLPLDTFCVHQLDFRILFKGAFFTNGFPTFLESFDLHCLTYWYFWTL
jgi:hypothetical protein